MEESSLKEHIDNQNNNYTEYITNLLLIIIKYNINLSIIKKARILASSLVRRDNELTKFLLDNYNYTMPEILKTCEILDSRRYSKSLKKKLEKIKDKKRITKLKSIISNLEKLHEGLQISLTKSKIEFLKINWIHKLSKEELENYTIQYPIKYWKNLIDLMHLRSDDFQLNWFTSYIFTGEAPHDSLTYKCYNINKDTINDIVTFYKPSFSYLRTHHKKLLNNTVINIVVGYTSIYEILNHWDDFNKDCILDKILNRLNKGEQLNIPYGELMKKIQYFWDYQTTKTELDGKYNELIKYLLKEAEDKLEEYQFSLEQPVVVLGDASASMNIAIKTSSIIMSILCKICKAKMHLFRDKDQYIENPPTTVEDVVIMSKKWEATGSTSPASCLYPYLERKEIVKTFIIVTDEEENTGYDGVYDDTNKFFDKVFKKYYDEVYPAKLVFVSFVKDNKDGFMVSKLKEIIPNINITQFRLNNIKPDLRKIDILLDSLGMQETIYINEYESLYNKLQTSNNKLNSGKQILSNEFNNEEFETMTVYI